MCSSTPFSFEAFVVVFFGAIFPSVVRIFSLNGAFWCEFSTRLVRLAETGDILYSLANMKAITVGSMRPKAAGSGERTSVGVRSGSVRLGIIRNRGIAEISCPLFTALTFAHSTFIPSTFIALTFTI